MPFIMGIATSGCRTFVGLLEMQRTTHAGRVADQQWHEGTGCHVGHASHIQLEAPQKKQCAELVSCGWLIGKMYLLKVS